jgi:hypothetical protein
MTEVETARRLDRAERRWLVEARRRLQQAARRPRSGERRGDAEETR